MSDIGADRTLALNDLVEASGRDADFVCEAKDADTLRYDETVQAKLYRDVSRILFEWPLVPPQFNSSMVQKFKVKPSRITERIWSV